ncbi:MAG: hypothetical protein R3279_10115 [Putridiphycobacter sp.]|nr:hypothetical protein [Putridiphycobacter sp.]
MKNISIILSAFCIQFSSQGEVSTDSILHDDFQNFKTQLEICAKQRDSALLSDLLHHRVLECWDAFDCAGEEGCLKSDFTRIFFSDTSSKEWETLSRLMEMGFRKTLDTLDYQFLHQPRSINCFVSPQYTVEPLKLYILTDNSKVYLAPSTKSQLLKTISCGNYTYQQDEYENPIIYEDTWLKLFFEDGSSGFVELKNTSQSINRELRVSKINGEWKIIAYECQNNL